MLPKKLQSLTQKHLEIIKNFQATQSTLEAEFKHKTKPNDTSQ